MELKIQEEFENKKFASEEEEANYWDSHQDELATEFEHAAENGTLGHGTAAKKAGSKENETIIPWYLIALGAPIMAISSIGNFFKRKFGKN